MEDPYRFCVYCRADFKPDDVEIPGFQPEHASDCPFVTGVYPVLERDLGPKCVHCGRGAFGGMQCMDCDQPLELGDHYMYRTVDEGDPSLPPMEGAPVYEVICVGCAAKEALTSS